MDVHGNAGEAQRWTRPRRGQPLIEVPTGAADPLSALPDELLLHILSLLELQDAIFTSRLCRRWRYLWRSLPSLDFSPCYSGSWKPLRAGLVDRVLDLHAAPRLHRFRLSMHARGPEAELRIRQFDLCVLYAVRHGVRVLDLDFLTNELDCDSGKPVDIYSNPDYLLPPYLFGCRSLEDLTVQFCYLHPPVHVRLDSLKTMHLSGVGIGEFVGLGLGHLLSGCPLLRSLRLEECHGMSDLDIAAGKNRHLENLEVYEGISHFPDEFEMKICAPSLKRVRFAGSVARGTYCVKDLSSLVDASFDLDLSLDLDPLVGSDRAIGDFSSFADLLDHVRHVQVLKLSSWCVQALSIREVQGLCLSSCFNVISLKLSIGLRKWELPGIFGAFRACEKLRVLTIDIRPKNRIQFKGGFLNEHDFDETEYLTSCVHSFEKVMQHLKTIKIEIFTGSDFWWKESTDIDDYVLREDSILAGYNEEVTGHGEEENKVADCTSQKHKAFIVFTGFLLKVSPALENLMVQTSNDLNKLAKMCELLSKLSSDLLSLPRASPNARVIISGK